jgi:hypothetical protein
MFVDTATIIGIVGTIVGIGIGALISIIIYRKQLEPKHLDYEFISGVHLVASEAARLAGDLKVTYKDQAIKDPYLLLVRLINTGNKHIESEDFDTPVRVELGASKVISAEVVKTSQEQMNPSLEVQENAVVLHPMLFNRNEWLAFTAVTDGEPTEKVVIARIAGGSEPREFKFKAAKAPTLEPLPVFAGFGVTFAGFGVLGTTLSRLFPNTYPSANSTDVPLIQNMLLIGGAIVCILLGVGATRSLRRVYKAPFERKSKELEVIL